MESILPKRIFYSIAFLFLIALLGLFMFDDNRAYIVSGIISFFVISLAISFTRVEPFLLLLVISLPVSFQMSLPQGGSTIIFPSELLCGLLFVVYFLRFFTANQQIDYKIIFHPITITVLIYILCNFLSFVFSSIPVVSFKTLVVKFVYITVYYFLMSDMLKSIPGNSLKYFIVYGYALAGVILYTLYIHFGFHFSKDTSGIVALPFYNDHTIYSACIAFVLPVFVLKALGTQPGEKLFWNKFTFGIFVLLFLLAIYFSLCRATWVSITLALLVLPVFLLRVKPLLLFSILALIVALSWMNSEIIFNSFKQNRYDSNARGAGIEEQTKSITNISNDQSNGERLNRWKCAIRMFEAKPWFGYGPGTFQFKYLSFQKANEMTRISVTNPYRIERGHGGTAHSEYFLALSEGGIFVFLSFLLICLTTVFIAMKNIYQKGNQKYRLINLAVLMSLITYLVHACFNNFLDTDKAAFLFWTAMAVITITDIALQKEKKLLLSL